LKVIMARLVIRKTDNGELHFRPDDVVSVLPDPVDDHSGGRMCSRAAWLASGRLAIDYPDNFIILDVPGVVADYQYLTASTEEGVKRLMTLPTAGLERRSESYYLAEDMVGENRSETAVKWSRLLKTDTPRRDTLKAYGEICRGDIDVHKLAQFK
jgi:hypothetical protein